MFFFSVFGMILIIVDIVLVIVDFTLHTNIIEVVSLVISFFFLGDVLMRVYVEGWEEKH